MSGIAPGSYLAYGIDIPEAVKNEIISGLKRGRVDETQDSSGASPKDWKTVDSSDSLKSVSRSKYKCSLCGQVITPQVCLSGCTL